MSRTLLRNTLLLIALAPLGLHAQSPFSCSVVDQPPAVVRAEGFTELGADLVVACGGGIAGSTLPIQFNVYAATNITSRIAGSGSEALLLVDEPAPSARVLNKNAFQGTVSGNLVSWNVTLTLPGTGIRTLRFSNIRLNANALYTGLSTAPPLLGVVEYVINGAKTDLPPQTLGYVLPSSSEDLRRCDDVMGSSFNMPQVGGHNPGLLGGGSGQIDLNVRFLEDFANVFRNQTQESGATLSATDPTGKADHGTRLTLIFNNLYAGVRVFVTTAGIKDHSATSSSVTASLTANASGPFQAVPPTVTGACVNSGATANMAEIPVNTGTATAVWEISSSDLTKLEQVSFGISFAYPATVTPLGNPTWNTNLAPITYGFRITDIPSFADISIARNLNSTATSVVSSAASGLTFVGVAGGAPIPPQTVLLPAGTTQVSTITVGNWLQVSGSQFTASSALPIGDYYGTAYAASAQGAVLATFSVALHLVAQSPGPIAYPQALIFPAFAGAGDQTTDPQTVYLTNLTGKTVTYTQTNPPGNGTLPPGVQVKVPLSVSIAGLALGIHNDSTTFSFSDGTSLTIPERVIVAPLPSNSLCSYTVSPTSWTIPAAGGTQAFQIQTTSGCGWTATGIPSWVTASGATAGTGPGTLTLTAAPNISAPRSSTLTIAGVSVTASQSAASSITGFTISTVAGNGKAGYSGDNGPTTQSQLGYNPPGVAVDSAGNVYIADTSRIRMVSNGVITTIAGTGVIGNSGDNGPATSAQIYANGGIAVDASGNVYYSDGYHCIREISGGTITSAVGICGQGGYSGDGGGALQAQLNGPQGIAFDSAGNLYIADFYNNRVRMVAGGVITTIAGTGTSGSQGAGGPATAAQLDLPVGVAADGSQNVYVSDRSSRFLVISNATLYSLAQSGPNANMGEPNGLTIAPNGVVYIADVNANQILSWTPGSSPANGVLARVAGNGGQGYSGDNGPALSATMNHPTFIASDSSGNLYFTDSLNSVVRELTPQFGASCSYTVSPTSWNPPAAGGTQAFQIQTSAGCSWSATNLPAWIMGSTALGSGNGSLTLAAALNTGAARTATIQVAGVSVSVSQPAASAPPAIPQSYTITNLTASANPVFNQPLGVAVDSSGVVYVADSNNNVIRQVLNGLVSVIAGNGNTFPRDGGAAILSGLNDPFAVAVDKAGSLYVSDTLNNCVRKVALTSSAAPGSGLAGATITTYAGQCAYLPFTPGAYGGDGGPATQANLNQPAGLAFDSAGNLYIADSFNGVIREVTTDGNITTVAGSPGGGQLSLPFGVAVDSNGYLYISDANRNTVLVMANGTLYTVAGDGTPGFADSPITGSAGSGSGSGSSSGTTPFGPPPPRNQGATLDTSTPLATNLVGLFLMNAGSGTTDQNLVDGKPAKFMGAAPPTWNTADPASVFNGGGSENSYMTPDQEPSGTNPDSNFDKLPTSKVTVVAKIYVNAQQAGGICEKNDANAHDGFVFALDPNGALRLIIERSVANMRAVTAGGAVTPGRWVQVAFTWDGTVGGAGSAHLYVDGAEQNKVTANDGAGTLGYAGATNYPFRIGNSTFDNSSSLNGKMAYLAVYRGRILSPAELGQLDSGLPIKGGVSSGSGAGSFGRLNLPAGLGFDANGALYIADAYNNRIRRWVPSSTPGAAPNVGTLTTIAGNGTAAETGDGGPALSASLNTPIGIALDAAGRIYVADSANNAVRVLTPLAGGSTGGQTSPMTLTAKAPAIPALSPAHEHGTSTRIQPVRPADSTPTCVPTAITAVFQQIGYVALLNVGWTEPVLVQVYDSCSQPVTAGTVIVSFSDQDSSITLSPSGLGDGVFIGQWLPVRFASSVTVTATVNATDLNLSVTEFTTVALSNQAPPPIVTAINVVTADGHVSPNLAAGASISIIGSGLGASNTTTSAIPLPTQLVSTQVFFNGLPLPLSLISPNQINAVLPFDTQPQGQNFLIVQNGSKNSAVLTLTIPPVSPGIFTSAQNNAQADIVDSNSGAAPDANHPAHVGDNLVIYCSGLGAVYPAVTAGTPAPSPPPQTVYPVSVTIGGVPATPSFVGLTAGSMGQYQLNVTIPPGVASGSAVPVVVTVEGQSSPPANIVVQ
jgi:uncharacterized protein (TIGR03437 family)